MNNKYHNSKIYKITSPNTQKIFIGSTTESLNRRFSAHKLNYNNYLREYQAFNLCFSSYEIFKSGEPKIELIEVFKCESKKELENRENYYLNLYKNIVVNKKVQKQINCVCGGKYKKSDKAKHLETKKHIKFMDDK